MPRIHTLLPASALLSGIFCLPALGNGIYREGIGARSMSMGGADAAYAADALGAMAANPAGLGFLHGLNANFGLFGGIPEGTFSKPSVSQGNLDSSIKGLPEAALALPLGDGPVTLGLSVVPDAVLSAKWNYFDPPGGANGITTYGFQEHRSEILVLRSAVGLGLQLAPNLSVGASLGLLYNENTLHAPYIFQSNPAVKGAKTLLDLNTSGYGWNGQVGLLYSPVTNVQFGVTYTSESRIYTDGDANGDIGAQFGVPSIPFHYDAEVRNVFPQSVDTGISWKLHPRWRLALQIDWINWSDSFQQLPVTLSNGSNPAVNGVVGSNGFQDVVPLNWKDEFVYRAGVEFNVTRDLSLRGGYSYGASPVPGETLTPLTAVLAEHTVSAGIGYKLGRWQFDVAYQYQFPAEKSVGTSSLSSGEYSNSSTTVSTHWLAITTGFKF